MSIVIWSHMEYIEVHVVSFPNLDRTPLHMSCQDMSQMHLSGPFVLVAAKADSPAAVPHFHYTVLPMHRLAVEESEDKVHYQLQALF